MAGKKASTQTDTKPKAKQPDPVLYVGPTLVKFGLIQNTHYTEIPESANKFLELCPMGRLLFTAIENYPEAEKQLREQNGYFWQAFERAIGLKNGGK